QVAHRGDGLALLHVAQLELLAIELRQLRGIELLDHLRTMACQIRCGVAGISRASTPSASCRALIAAAGAAIVPASPQPLAPSGLWAHGWLSSVSESNIGRSDARGSA